MIVLVSVIYLINLNIPAEDIKAYSAHPEHVKVADTYVRPFVTERACLDYQD